MRIDRPIKNILQNCRSFHARWRFGATGKFSSLSAISKPLDHFGRQIMGRHCSTIDLASRFASSARSCSAQRLNPLGNAAHLSTRELVAGSI
jgi:hypothetical protein